MATAQQIWDDAQTKIEARKQAESQVDADKVKLSDDAAVVTQAQTAETDAENRIRDKFPEGHAFVFGAVSVMKLNGEIVVVPVIDTATDLGD